MSGEEARLHAKLAQIRRRLKNREVECQVLSALLSGSLDASADPTAILDARGTVLAINRAWQRYEYGLHGSGDASGLSGRDILAVQTELKRVLDGQARDAFVRHSADVDGVPRCYETHIARIEDGARWVIVVHHDVTETEAARHAVMSLTEQLVSMQEEERERIARDLHDSTSQHLASVGLQLLRLRHVVTADAGCERIIGQISASLRQAQVELRAFTYLLHPPELDRDGLKATSETFVAGFAERTRLKCRCRIDAAVDELPFEAQCSVFRVLQEALTNVYRHARAANVHVSLRTTGSRLRLAVRDDGQGMSKTCSPAGGHRLYGVGIPGMQARMRRLGGNVIVKSGSGGTTVVATVPLTREQDRPVRQQLSAGGIVRAPRNGRTAQALP